MSKESLGNQIREVNIGNGKTIKVTDNDKVHYYLDFSKLSVLVKKHKEVTVGAIDDWFFTARTIDGKDLEDIKSYKQHILRSSSWSKFVVRWDDNEEDITLEIPLEFAEYPYREGFANGIEKIQNWFPGLYHDCIKKFKYKDIKKLQGEINPIIEKYVTKKLRKIIEDL